MRWIYKINPAIFWISFLIIISLWYGLPYLTKNYLQHNHLNAFKSLGWQIARVESSNSSIMQYTAQNLALDKDFFSTIDELKLHFPISALWQNNPLITGIVVNGARFSGAYLDNKFTIAGYNGPIPPDYIDNRITDLNLDIVSPYGGLSFIINGYAQNGKGRYNIKTAQYQLTFDGILEFTPDNFTLTLNGFDISLPEIQISRAQIEYSDTTATLIAGLVKYAGHSFNNVKIVQQNNAITASAELIRRDGILDFKMSADKNYAMTLEDRQGRISTTGKLENYFDLAEILDGFLSKTTLPINPPATFESTSN